MFIGRKKEVEILKNTYKSGQSEFVTVYGRRRIGKTFLVRYVFNNSFTFEHSGLAGVSMQKQLQAWYFSLKEYGLTAKHTPKNWIEAFDLLKQLIKSSRKKKKVIFIDEMPWLDTKRSGFVSALEFFWNSWASSRNDILLIVCGSSTSWIINKIIKNHGGLHNRVTKKIHLQPFTLHECESYAKAAKLHFSRYQVLECYMIIGGVPFYWSCLESGKTLSENIDDNFFDKQGQLYGEFHQLYASLFANSEPYIEVIKVLGQKKIGMTRNELLEKGKLEDNGRLTAILTDLEYCGFIRKYNSIGHKAKNATYQLIDAYTLFYFHFIAKSNNNRYLWSSIVNSPVHKTWSGLAFEMACLNHSKQIKDALGISGIMSEEYSWIFKSKDSSVKSAQIDMVIDRKDNVINLCEMKFSTTKFNITKKYMNELNEKLDVFLSQIPMYKSANIVMVTTYGLVKNMYSHNIFKTITLNDIFKQ